MAKPPEKKPAVMMPWPVSDVAEWGDRRVAGSLADLSAEEMAVARKDSKRMAAEAKKQGLPSLAPRP